MKLFVGGAYFKINTVPISKNRGRQINEGGGLTVDYGMGDCISPKLPVAKR